MLTGVARAQSLHCNLHEEQIVGGYFVCHETLSRNPYTRGHHLGRGSRQTKKNLMNQAIGHEFPLCGHRTWPIVMHT